MTLLEDDFVEQQVTFALVMRLPLAEVKKVKQELAKNGEIELIYQRTSIGQLWIVDKPQQQIDEERRQAGGR